MIKKIEIDLDSLSYFWLILNNQGMIQEASVYFMQYNCIGKRIDEIFEFIQPSIGPNSKSDLNSFLIGKIIHLKSFSTKMNFRCTAHLLGEQLLMQGWPTVNRLEDLKNQDLAKYMRHPACQITDTIILNDVLKKTQYTIRNLEKEQYLREIEEQRSIAQHQSKLASIGELSAGIAHEINNPLAVSMGLADVLKNALSKEKIENSKVFEYLNKIYIANTRIRNIVKGLQSYARIDKTEVEVFLLKDVISQTLDLFSGLFAKDGIELKTIGNLENIKVKGLFGELQQVLVNLLNNAKHSVAEKEVKNINIAVNLIEKGRVELIVVDNGHGIPAELVDKIFRPFFTTKAAGSGTGLGLAISYNIIKKMNGDILVNSVVGEGTKFTVVLPVVT